MLILSVGRKYRGLNVSYRYRYGFNGKEKDDEVSGKGNQYDYGFRIYNPRLGRFLSVDPLFSTKGLYPWYSPYHFAGNSPILNVDVEGLEEADAVKLFISKQLKAEIKLVNEEITGSQENVKIIERQIIKLNETREIAKKAHSITHSSGQGGTGGEILGEGIKALFGIPQLDDVDKDLTQFSNYKEALNNHIMEMREKESLLSTEIEMLDNSQTINGDQDRLGIIEVKNPKTELNNKALENLHNRIDQADEGKTILKTE